jgi:hypothetical protein
MLAFLGWVSILHFGPNQSECSRGGWQLIKILMATYLLISHLNPLDMYPFFAFADKRDPYNYQLTMLGSLAIWASELMSSFVARQVS